MTPCAACSCSCWSMWCVDSHARKSDALDLNTAELRGLWCPLNTWILMSPSTTTPQDLDLDPSDPDPCPSLTGSSDTVMVSPWVSTLTVAAAWQLGNGGCCCLHSSSWCCCRWCGNACAACAVVLGALIVLPASWDTRDMCPLVPPVVLLVLLPSSSTGTTAVLNGTGPGPDPCPEAARDPDPDTATDPGLDPDPVLLACDPCPWALSGSARLLSSCLPCCAAVLCPLAAVPVAVAAVPVAVAQPQGQQWATWPDAAPWRVTCATARRVGS